MANHTYNIHITDTLGPEKIIVTDSTVEAETPFQAINRALRLIAPAMVISIPTGMSITATQVDGE